MAGLVDQEGRTVEELLRHNENYRWTRDLGKGGFGLIVEAIVKTQQIEQEPGDIVAIKFISMLKPYLRSSDEEKRYRLKCLRRELVSNVWLRHPHICGYRSCFLSGDFLAIVLDCAPCGDMQHYCREVQKSRKRFLTENEARLVMQQVFLAVDYCHAQGVVHRDIKPKNMLLGPNELREVRLADFGQSLWQEVSRERTDVGTPNYKAPEVTSGERYHGESADIWSCGQSLHKMLFGKVASIPHPQDSINRELHMNRSQTDMDGRTRLATPKEVPVSPACRDFLQGCLQFDPAHRPKMEQILGHEWLLQNADNQSLNDRRTALQLTFHVTDVTHDNALRKEAQARNVVYEIKRRAGRLGQDM